jgi:hypothetical protein
LLADWLHRRRLYSHLVRKGASVQFASGRKSSRVLVAPTFHRRDDSQYINPDNLGRGQLDVSAAVIQPRLHWLKTLV